MKHIFDDADKNKYAAYTKQEVLAVIQEAISTGELPEEINGLVLTFKNPIDNLGYKIAFCTQAKYNELKATQQLEQNCLYYIIDDTTLDDINGAIDDINEDIENINDEINNASTGLKIKVNQLYQQMLSKVNEFDTYYDTDEEIQYELKILKANRGAIDLSVEGDNFKALINIYNGGINIIRYENGVMTALYELFSLGAQVEENSKSRPQIITNIDTTNNRFFITKSGLYEITMNVSTSNSKERYTALLSVENIEWLKTLDSGTAGNYYYKTIINNKEVYAYYSFGASMQELKTQIKADASMPIVSAKLLIEY